MRVIVALRPTNRHGTKGEYTSFRKLLIATGFVLVQPEVFIATVTTRRAAQHLIAKLRDSAPSTGAVCALTLTERQYSSIDYLVGSPSYQELHVSRVINVSL